MTVTGWPVGTIIRGTVMWEGEVVTPVTGPAGAVLGGVVTFVPLPVYGERMPAGR